MSFQKISSDFIDLNSDNYLPKITTSSITDQGYRLYNDSASAPVDGTGGTTTGVTLAPDSTTLLGSAPNLRFTKDASNRQGCGFSRDFTINNIHLARVQQLTFDFSPISGTFATGDIKIYLIQDPTGTPVVIEPVNVSLQVGVNGSSGKHIATFQTHITLKTYRLCVHVASTSAVAYTLDFSNFKIWEPSQNYGAIITDWTAYTPTFTALGTVTGIDYVWRRNGGYLEVIGKHINGTCTGSTIAISLPPGLVVLSNGVIYSEFVGEVQRDFAGEQYCAIVLDGDTAFGVGNMNPASNPWSKITGTVTSLDTTAMRISAKVRIKGWGSNMALSSSDGDGRLVSGSYYGHTGVALTADVTTVKFNSLIKDSHAIYNTATGVTTIPVAGDYVFGMTSMSAGAGGTRLQAFINGVTTNHQFMWMTNALLKDASIVIPNLKAGDTVDFRAFTGFGDTTSSSTYANFFFYRVNSGNQIIASSEIVACSYYNRTTVNGSTSQMINFDTKVFDTHSAVTSGGAGNFNWKFTAPMVGKYNLSGFETGATARWIQLYKNGTLYEGSIVYDDATSGMSFGYEINLLAGDYIDIRPNGASNFGGGTQNSAGHSHISIHRVGV